MIIQQNKKRDHFYSPTVRLIGTHHITCRLRKLHHVIRPRPLCIISACCASCWCKSPTLIDYKYLLAVFSAPHCQQCVSLIVPAIPKVILDV